MTKAMFDEILHEAICIVADYNGLGREFVSDTYPPERILREAKCINRQREKRMDYIREGWAF